jgi:flagellar motility protein MotE (MotC chaperone)
MTRKTKAESVPSRIAAYQNRIMDFQVEAQEVNPPDIEALQQESNYNRLVLERTRLRAWAANLDDDNRSLREENREWREEVMELEEEIRQLEEENRELQQKVKNRNNILIIIFVYSLVIFVNKVFKYFEIL